MKKKIAILRIFGVFTFVVFVISLVTKSTPPQEFTFSQLEKLLIFTSFACFGIVMAMQVYRFYIQNYYRQEENDADDQE